MFIFTGNKTRATHHSLHAVMDDVSPRTGCVMGVIIFTGNKTRATHHSLHAVMVDASPRIGCVM